MKRASAALFVSVPLLAAHIAVPGLKQPVEILRDRWGVPHIYAQNTADLFFAQGYIAARDRLWQIDLWRRIGTGRLAEVLGPSFLDRDKLARAVRFRGDMQTEWASYGPGTREIAVAFTSGINAWIRSLGAQRPLEFRVAGYGPGLWQPEDCLARVAGLLMTRNLTREVSRAISARQFGLAALERYAPPDPPIPLALPKGLDLADVTPEITKNYEAVIGEVRYPAQGSNNWVVDGTLTATGKPILANDPHRPVQIPSLRKTVHLVAPGWNAIGAGEPALPGIALGHNDRIAFGFTIVGIDQQDLYIEKLNPANPGEYWYRGAWKKLETERQSIRVRGAGSRTVELRYTVHGPVIYEDRARHRAYALRWVGMEPGTAGYLAGIAVARASNWNEFAAAMERYKVPSENIVYADVDGNIGWQAAGMAPIRPNWSGLFPVPGDGAYEWAGFRPVSELPRRYNPTEHFIATANHNILPPGYTVPLGYEWALPFRYERIREMLTGAQGKFTVRDFEHMQQDVTSIPARRFQAVVRRWNPSAALAREIIDWDGALRTDSRPAAVYEAWIRKLPARVFGAEIAKLTDLRKLLETVEEKPDPKALAASFDEALAELAKELGPDRSSWTWGRLHRIYFRHPLDRPGFNRGPVSRPGDGNTVNATGGKGYEQSTGASYREIIDLSDWDKSVMTNVPGESGDPTDPHYADLLDAWAEGRYHPMPFSRRAVEEASRERMTLIPSAANATASPASASAR